MTAATTPLYPVTYGGWPGCSLCFQTGGDLAHDIDPRDPDGDLIVCHGACHRELAAGRDVPLPTGEALVETWERLARLHQNGEIDEQVIDAALTALCPIWLPPQGRWARFEALVDALLRLQAAEDSDTVLDAELIGDEHDPETYLNHCRGLVNDAHRALTGGRS